MNEAAIPSEAFDPSAPVVPELVASAASYGYPDDRKWEDQWTQIISDRQKPLSPAACEVIQVSKDCWSF